MLDIVGVEVLPLESKHYSTDVRVEVKGSVGKHYSLIVSISGYYPVPSAREIQRGWEPDWGMDHTESSAHWFIARTIEKALRGE
jgi:hypothetical protein